MPGNNLASRRRPSPQGMLMGEIFSYMFTKRSLRRCPDDSSTFDLAFTCITKCTNVVVCPSGCGEPFFSFPRRREHAQWSLHVDDVVSQSSRLPSSSSLHYFRPFYSVLIAVQSRYRSASVTLACRIQTSSTAYFGLSHARTGSITMGVSIRNAHPWLVMPRSSYPSD